jgi:hypothetical protein
MPDNQSDDIRARMREAIYQMLINKIAGDRYPSATMMNMVEAAVDDERLLQAYAEVLFDKISGDRFPSPDMMKRLTSLV